MGTLPRDALPCARQRQLNILGNEESRAYLFYIYTQRGQLTYPRSEVLAGNLLVKISYAHVSREHPLFIPN